MGERPDSTVEVVAYRDEWPDLFESERVALAAVLGDIAREIEHIGSTSVPGLSSKPTIDILVVVDDPSDFLTLLPRVEALGYEHRPESTLESDEHLFLRNVVAGKRTTTSTSSERDRRRSTTTAFSAKRCARTRSWPPATSG